jgi:hypothetical protein
MLKSTSHSSKLLTLINAPLAIMHEESSGQSDCACSNLHVKKHPHFQKLANIPGPFWHIGKCNPNQQACYSVAGMIGHE